MVNPEPRQILLQDDGMIPNSRLPLLVYSGALGTLPDRASAFEALFASNGWGRSWRNGIYAYRHYHSTVHEVLGIAVGSARVEFGGPKGQELDVQAGDAVLIPAGVSHFNRGATEDLLVIGAYLNDSESVDLRRDTSADRSAAMPQILKVPMPLKDPVSGEGLKAWES